MYIWHTATITTITMPLKNPLKCLLSVDVTDDWDYGTILNITEMGGNYRRIKPPFNPYYYSRKFISGSQAVQRTLLSDNQIHTVYKKEFQSQKLLERSRNEYTIEDRLPFKMRVAIDIGFHFPSKFPKIIAWDCETKLAGLNPNPMKDRLISIATWGENPEDRRYFSGDRRKMILDFLAFWRKANSDVPADFYGRFYDYQVLLNNCHELTIKCALGRDGTEPFILKKEFEKMGKGHTEHTVIVKGRVAFDIHKEVEGDYTLTLAGLKTRGLKETAKHYGMNPIEIDYDKMDLLTEEELRDYNLSDAEVTYNEALIYLRPLYEIAEYLDIPLDMVVQRAPSHIANIVIGRGFVKAGIISDGANCDRFPQIFQAGRKAIQGAEPRCFRSGIFLERVKHKDFMSMYVSVNRALNLSPETVQLIDIKPYTGVYNFVYKKEEQCCIAEVPDKQNGQVTIRIDLSKKGVMRQALDDITARRMKAKKLWRSTNDPKYDSEQIALKLIGNIFFGYNTMPYAMYGNVCVGILDTAVPRLLIDTSMAMEKEAGNIILEVDTDGYWYIEDKAVEFEASSVLPDCFELALIKQEKEDAEGMIILQDKEGEPAAKSYILKKDGKVTKHGSSVLGRHIPVVVDAFVDDLAQSLFARKDPETVLRSWNKKKILSFPLKAFVSSAKFTKHPDDYESTSMYATLIAQLRKAGIVVEWGNNVSFVKTRRGYVPSMFLSGTETIDVAYYQSRMCDVASRILGRTKKDLMLCFDGNSKLEMYF